METYLLLEQQDQTFAELLKVTQKKSFDRGDFVYRSGDPARGLYLVEEGLVGLSILGPSGKEHLMRFFRTGQVFGHRVILAEKEFYHATTQVLEKSDLLFVSRDDVKALLESQPRLYSFVVRQLALELSNCEQQQINILDQQILPRVAQALVYLKEVRPNYRWTRSELASFCASTTSTVIKALAELEYMGYIKQRGRDIHIQDRAALIQLQFQYANS